MHSVHATHAEHQLARTCRQGIESDPPLVRAAGLCSQQAVRNVDTSRFATGKGNQKGLARPWSGTRKMLPRCYQQKPPHMPSPPPFTCGTSNFPALRPQPEAGSRDEDIWRGELPRFAVRTLHMNRRQQNLRGWQATAPAAAAPAMTAAAAPASVASAAAAAAALAAPAARPAVTARLVGGTWRAGQGAAL